MAKFLDKTNVQTPVKRWRSFDNSCQQLTTAFFMRPTVVYAAELPANKVKCNLKSYARLQPLLKPVLGSVQVHNRAFWVPMRTVWPCWDNFIVASPYTTPDGTRVINAVPTISNRIIAYCFVNPLSGLTIDDHNFTGQADFACRDPDLVTEGSFLQSYRHYRFTAFGRHVMKVLNQLGYRIHFGDGNPSAQVTWPVDYHFSFLPLLCFAKIFLDWMYPAQYAHSGDAAVVEGMFQRGFRYDATADDFIQLCTFTAWAYYGNDYFTSAFDTPVAPSAGYDVGMTVPDISSDSPQSIYTTNSFALNVNSQVVSLSSNGTPVGHGVMENFPERKTPFLFTQYLDDSVKKMTNWQRRHQLVGVRVLDRYLADFGVVPSWEQLKRSQFIGSQSFPIQFQDVVSTSDTVQTSGDDVYGAQLGAYAGKGVAFDGQGNFEFSSDEFGYFMIINTIVPDIAYYQGVNRQVMHKGQFDFMNGQWESLGTQPVDATELFLGYNSGGLNVNQIFGFLPRYAEYKCGKDLITGLFNYASVNRGLMAWSTARSVNAADRHGIGFLRGDDAWQYARIFYGDVEKPDDELDKFIFVHRINIKVSMQASPMYDVYEFDEPEGDNIMMQVNGAKL